MDAERGHIRLSEEYLNEIQARRTAPPPSIDLDLM